MIKSPVVIGRKLIALGVADTALGELPAPLRRAVNLMLAGAAGSALWGILSAISVGVYRDAVDSAGKVTRATGAQTAGGIVFSLLVMIIFAAAWVLMARKNQEGRGWARITGSALFLLWSLWTWINLGTIVVAPLPIAITVVTVVIWAAGAVALFLMWRPESGAYYKSVRDSASGGEASGGGAVRGN